MQWTDKDTMIAVSAASLICVILVISSLAFLRHKSGMEVTTLCDRQSAEMAIHVDLSFSGVAYQDVLFLRTVDVPEGTFLLEVPPVATRSNGANCSSAVSIDLEKALDNEFDLVIKGWVSESEHKVNINHAIHLVFMTDTSGEKLDFKWTVKWEKLPSPAK
jgi:hypothetical protein